MNGCDQSSCAAVVDDVVTTIAASSPGAALQSASQRLNRKLRDVAEDVVTSGETLTRGA